VVFPASMWAAIPIFRIRPIFDGRLACEFAIGLGVYTSTKGEAL